MWPTFAFGLLMSAVALFLMVLFWNTQFEGKRTDICKESNFTTNSFSISRLSDICEQERLKEGVNEQERLKEGVNVSIEYCVRLCSLKFSYLSYPES